MQRDLTGQIIDIFKSTLDWTVYYVNTKNDKLYNTDGQIQINTDSGGIQLVCEIKKTVIPASIPSVKNALANIEVKTMLAHGTILLSNYISSSARKLLKQNDINYADTAGNIHIAYQDIYIHIETGQSNRSAITNNGGRAFTKSGLKVLYQYFRSEETLDINGQSIDVEQLTINDPIRKLSKQAQVSKDTVSKVIQGLLEQGYILRKNNKEYIWKNKAQTFERWVERVNEVLRPSLKSKKYKLIGDPLQHKNLPKGYQLGGYHGAERYVQVENQIINAPYIIYSHIGFDKAVQDLKIVPDPTGDVTVFEAFWEDDRYISPSADFPVVYADLINSEDPRMHEVAQLIYRNYIHDQL